MTFDFLRNQNNMTLASLKTQDFSGAIESALFALRHLKALEAASPTKSSSVEEGSDCLDQCMLLSEVKETVPQHDDATHHGFVYDHGIFIHSSLSDCDYSIVAPILIFNTALTYHLAVGAGYSTTPNETLQKARQLYELANKSLVENDMLDSNNLFQFAVINNIAMIDRRMGNLEMSNECLEYLMTFWMLLVDSGCTMHLRHVQGFLINIPSSSTTAAAA